MKASEIIVELNKIIDEKGDLDVMLLDDRNMRYDDIGQVFLKTDKRIPHEFIIFIF